MQTAQVPGQAPIGSDHAVTGDDDRQWVAANSGAHRPHEVGPPESDRKLRVGDGLAVRDRLELTPNGLLKRSSCREVEFEIELPPGAREVLIELLCSLSETPRIAADLVQARRTSWEEQAIEPAAVGRSV